MLSRKKETASDVLTSIKQFSQYNMKITVFIQRNVSFILCFKCYKRCEPFWISSKRTLNDYMIVTGERNRSMKETAFISEYHCRSRVTLLPINLLSRKLQKKKTLDTSTSNANIFIFTHHFSAALVENQIPKDLFVSFFGGRPRVDAILLTCLGMMGILHRPREECEKQTWRRFDDVCDVMMLKDKHNSINRWYISKAQISGRYSSNVLSEKSV